MIQLDCGFLSICHSPKLVRPSSTDHCRGPNVVTAPRGAQTQFHSVSTTWFGPRWYNQSMLTLRPKTSFGKYTGYTFFGFLILSSIFGLLIYSGQRGGEYYFSNLYLAIPFTSAVILAMTTFFLGLYSTIKQKERSILVFLFTIIGLLILLFISAEIIFPH